jgi:hypothetical protein
MDDPCGRARQPGRDGRAAASIVIIRSLWKPQSGGNDSADKEAMQLYLGTLYCCRGVLSQFLDQKPDWRWCMEGEEPCQICGKGQKEAQSRLDLNRRRMDRAKGGSAAGSCEG